MPTPLSLFGGTTTAQFAYTLRWVADNAEGTGDGTGSGVAAGAGNSWTLAQAMTSAVAGQQVMVQDDGVYSLAAGVTISGAGTANGGFVVFAGTGNQNGADNNGGRPIIDLQDNAGNVITMSALSMLERLDVRQGGSDGVLTAADNVILDCHIHDNGLFGIDPGGSRVLILGCDIYSNSSSGVDGRLGIMSLFNRFYLNFIGIELNIDSSMAALNQVFDNTSFGILFDTMAVMLFNTVDANGGHQLEGTSGGFSVALGNLITNAPATKWGINTVDPATVLDLFNHYHNNAAGEATANTLQTDKSSGDPDYVAVGSDDYSLGGSSNADNLEMPTPFAVTNPFFDKGSGQREVAAGGGGLLVHPGTSGGARG